jgi:hypothetical protein
VFFRKCLQPREHGPHLHGIIWVRAAHEVHQRVEHDHSDLRVIVEKFIKPVSIDFQN